VAICKAALLWLLLVCRCEDVSAEVRRLTASILSNLSRQPLNRSRFYRAELAMKRDDTMQLQAADGASRRKVFFGPKRWTPDGGELDGDDDEDADEMDIDDVEEEEAEEAAGEESSELGELPAIGESESLHSGSQVGSRVGSRMSSRKASLRSIVQTAEQEAAAAASTTGSRRVSAVHSEGSGGAVPGSRRVSMQQGEARVRSSVHGVDDVSTSADATDGGGGGGGGDGKAQREKRGKLRQRFMQFSESVEAERVEGQEELQWLTVGGLPADVSSAWVQQRQSLQSEERPEWVARLQPEAAEARASEATAAAAASVPQKRGGLAPLGQNLRRPLRDIWKHEEDEEPLQASPWQPDIVLIQTRADSQRRRRRRPTAKRVPSLDVVVGTGGDRNVIHFRDKGRKKLLFNLHAPQVPRLDMFEHTEGCTLCRLMGFDHFVLPDGKVRIERIRPPLLYRDGSQPNPLY